MAKFFCSVLIMTAITITSFGQTTKPAMDKAKNDPQTTTQAAKADAQLINKKNVTANADTRTVIAANKKKFFKKKRTSPKRSR